MPRIALILLAGALLVIGGYVLYGQRREIAVVLMFVGALALLLGAAGFLELV